jgi:transposase
MDVGRLLGMLMRYHLGEKKVWSVVHVPSAGAEDERQLHREMMALKRERTRHINRVKGLLAGQGVVIEVGSGFMEEIGAVRLWDNSPLPGRLRKRLEREYERMELLKQQIGALEKEREEVLRTSKEEAVEQVRRLDRGELSLVICDGVFCLARISEPAGGGIAGRADTDAISERGEFEGTWNKQGR